MGEEWIVRVEGKEFGPADLRTLEEWRDDGRLLAENPVRKPSEETWSTAREIPGLFPAGLTTSGEPAALRQPRDFSLLIAETFRIYRLGFPQFICLSLLVGLPSLALQISLAFVSLKDARTGAPNRVASACAVVALALVVVAWPIFVAGLQILSGEILAGSILPLRDLLRRAIGFWPRVAKLCLLVYSSFAFWTVIPFLAILSLLTGDVSLLSILLALAVLACLLYMSGRLFVNFLFWQQSAVLANRPGIEALLESRQLARSRPTAPRLQRPLYRGAIIASIWLLVLLALSVGIELPFLSLRMRGITNVEEATALMQTLLTSAPPDWITFTTYTISSLVHAVLRPLLGIAFVVLYYDTKDDR